MTADEIIRTNKEAMKKGEIYNEKQFKEAIVDVIEKQGDKLLSIESSDKVRTAKGYYLWCGIEEAVDKLIPLMHICYKTVEKGNLNNKGFYLFLS